MQAPPGLPPRIRSDETNAFAHHTMAVRVPAIIGSVLDRNPDYPRRIAERLSALESALPSNQPLPQLDEQAPHARQWLTALMSRPLERWLNTDWFFAENYLYRLLADATEFWTNGRDPFAPNKREEYASTTHGEALEAAVRISGLVDERIERLLGAALFGNRIDLSFAASRARGTSNESSDLLVDDRRAAVRVLQMGAGAVHIVVDNAGTELSVDLVLASALIELLAAPIVLHVKVHPCFVSDAIEADVRWFLEADDAAARTLWSTCSESAVACRGLLRDALSDGRLQIAPHPFWNGPGSLWECPDDLADTLGSARLVIFKGDAHYRRVVGDASWRPEARFSAVTSYFPSPLLVLRTLKSDAIVGLRPGLAEELERVDATWRVNGRRGVACLGGNGRG